MSGNLDQKLFKSEGNFILMQELKKEKEALINYWVESKTVTRANVIEAFQKVPREKFVLKQYAGNAYSDHPLPIPGNQTISQPTTVMLMTQELELETDDKVLEIGTGSGYQTAIISKIIGSKGKVISVEVLPELIGFAKSNLKKAGIKNVKVIQSKENEIGCKEYAPYDKIIVTAAMPEMPNDLYNQLKDGGIIVAPVGDGYSQEMVKIRKLFGTKFDIKRLGMFQFVPCKGKFGF